MGLFHYALLYMGDLYLVHPALNLSIMNAGIAVHLEFVVVGQVQGAILRCSYSFMLKSCGVVVVVVGGLDYFSVSPSALWFQILLGLGCGWA